MKLELDKDDLIAMVNGVIPYYTLFNDPLIKQCRQHVGTNSIVGWSWNQYKLETLSEQELFQLYTICKNSWELIR